jgi:hypothetical protein
VSPVKYDLGFYIPEDDILHSYRRGAHKCYYCYVGNLEEIVKYQLPFSGNTNLKHQLA